MNSRTPPPTAGGVPRITPQGIEMTQTGQRRSSPVTGVRVAALLIIWVAVVSQASPPLGLYYEALAAWYTVPMLGLIYVYCASHRSRSTALLAVVATVAAILIIGFCMVIPKASAGAVATISQHW